MLLVGLSGRREGGRETSFLLRHFFVYLFVRLRLREAKKKDSVGNHEKKEEVSDRKREEKIYQRQGREG